MSFDRPLLTVLIVILGIAIVFVASRIKKKEHSQLERLLQSQAKKWGGRVKPGSLLYYPRLLLSHGGTDLTVSALTGGRRPDRRPTRTYVWFSLPVPEGHGFRITKKTKSLQSFVDGKVRGSQIETRDPAFDEAFRVESENDVTTLEFLSQETRRSLLAFDEAADVLFDRSHFTITVDGIVEREATLDRMIELAIHAHDALRYLVTDSSGARNQRTTAQQW